MRKFLLGAAAAASIALAMPAMAFDFGVVLGAGQTQAVSGGGVAAGSGAIGGSLLLGVTGIQASTISQSNGAVQATNVTTAVPLGNQSTVLHNHNAGSVSTLTGGSLGLAGSGGLTGGSAGSIGQGAAGGGYLGLGVSLKP